MNTPEERCCSLLNSSWFVAQEFNKSENVLSYFARVRSRRDRDNYHHGNSNRSLASYGRRNSNSHRSQASYGDHQQQQQQTQQRFYNDYNQQPRSYTDQNDQFDPPDTHNGTLVPSNSFNSGGLINNFPKTEPAAPPIARVQQTEQPKQEPTSSSSGNQPVVKQEHPVVHPKKNYASTPLLAPELPQLSPSLLNASSSRPATASYDRVQMPLELSSITVETSRTPQLTQSVLTSADESFPAARARDSLIKTVTPTERSAPKPAAPSGAPATVKLESLPALSPMSGATKADSQNPARPPLPSAQQVNKPAEPAPDADMPDVCLTYKQNGMSLLQMGDNELYKVYISHSISPSIFW